MCYFVLLSMAMAFLSNEGKTNKTKQHKTRKSVKSFNQGSWEDLLMWLRAANARHAIGQSHEETQKKRRGGGGERKSPLVQPPLINSGKMNHGRPFQTHPGLLITSYPPKDYFTPTYLGKKKKSTQDFWAFLKWCIHGFTVCTQKSKATSSTMQTWEAGL